MRHTKKAVFVIFGSAVVAGGGFLAYGVLQPAITPEGTRLGDLDLGGITRDQMLSQLSDWWRERQGVALEPHSEFLKKQPPAMTLADMGIKPDWHATIATVRFITYFDRTFARAESAGEVEIVWKTTPGEGLVTLSRFVKENAVDWKPAKVLYANGGILRQYEVPTFSLDESNIAEAMLAAVDSGETRFTLPMAKNAPKIPDEMLDRITEVMSEFSTSFNETQANRSSNIRLACKALNGQIVMPGEEISYNTVVGKRTAENGYMEAPVFKNGKKVLDNGGGVCQVSTTMFNAALFADLEIVKRTNHSRRVPYVPMGRDATVDYSSGVDLVVKNPYDFPIAISSEVRGNTVTFRVLGQKDESKTISIVTTNHKYWANAVQYVDDPTAPIGKEVVVDSGAGGGSCQTWRIVKRNGVEIKRENIGKSRYPGAAKIIARNPAAAPPMGSPDGMPVVNPQKKDEVPNGEPKPMGSTTTNGNGGGH